VRLNTDTHAAQPAVISASTELAIISAIPAIVPAEFFKPNGADAVLSALKTEVRKVAATLDISTPGGREGIASLAYKVARSKTALDEQGKDLASAIKKQTGEIDAERKRVRDELDALKDEVRKPLTDWENAGKERIAAHEQELQEIANAGPYTLTNWSVLSVEAMRDRLREIETDPRDWQEFATRAAQTKAYAKEQILQGIEAKEAYDAAQVELERLRAEAAERAIKEREEAAAKAAQEAAERRAAEQARIAREAAERERQRVENERIEAEARAKQAEAQRIAAEERAARELAEAEERRVKEAAYAEQKRVAAEKEAARQLELTEARRIADEQSAARRAEEAAAQAIRDQERAIEAERQRVAAQKKAEADEAEKRAKNRAHQGAIHREIVEALAKLGLPEDGAKRIIEAIVQGRVPHVTISY
jgi:hypothetical protein